MPSRRRVSRAFLAFAVKLPSMTVQFSILNLSRRLRSRKHEHASGRDPSNRVQRPHRYVPPTHLFLYPIMDTLIKLFRVLVATKLCERSLVTST
jgi:hypothetical protein